MQFTFGSVTTAECFPSRSSRFGIKKADDLPDPVGPIIATCSYDLMLITLHFLKGLTRRFT